MSGIYQNGYTEASEESDLIYACTPPSYLNPPSLVAVSSTEITLQWQYPLNMGYCTLSGFGLHMNDGAGGDVYSEIDASSIRDKPSYTRRTTSAPTVVGATYMFKVEAYNQNGQTFSEAAGFVLAGLPATPPNAPTSNAAKTSATMLSIVADPVVDDGGSPILSYSVEIDDGYGREFTALFGDEVNSLTTSIDYAAVEKGNVYRVRCRVRNAVGWSDYSPIGYLRAADRPSAPLTPQFVSATGTTILLALLPSEDNGGAVIDAYELWIDDGELGTFTKLDSYDGHSTSFTIDSAVETQLISGKIYRVKYLARNEMGNSAFSETVSAAMADLPGQPLAPVKNLGLSTEAKIVIDWTAVADTQAPGGAITNYKVFMDSRTSGDFQLVHYASSSLT